VLLQVLEDARRPPEDVGCLDQITWENRSCSFFLLDSLLLFKPVSLCKPTREDASQISKNVGCLNRIAGANLSLLISECFQILVSFL
jgi:hypothetical protein